MSDEKNPGPEPASGPSPEPVPEPIPQPAPPTQPVAATGPVPTKVRWRERAFTLRSLVAVALAGVVLGAGAGVATTLLVDDDHGDRPGRHWMDGPGRGDLPGRGGPGQGGRPDFAPPGQQQDAPQEDQSQGAS